MSKEYNWRPSIRKQARLAAARRRKASLWIIAEIYVPCPHAKNETHESNKQKNWGALREELDRLRSKVEEMNGIVRYYHDPK